MKRPRIPILEVFGKFYRRSRINQSLRAECTSKLKSECGNQIGGLFVCRQDCLFVDAPTVHCARTICPDVVADLNHAHGGGIKRRIFLQELLNVLRRNAFVRQALQVESLKVAIAFEHLQKIIFLNNLAVAQGKSFARDDLLIARREGDLPGRLRRTHTDNIFPVRRARFARTYQRTIEVVIGREFPAVEKFHIDSLLSERVNRFRMRGGAMTVRCAHAEENCNSEDHAPCLDIVFVIHIH